MTKSKNIERHVDLKCMSCKTVYRDIPIGLVEELEASPSTKELRCSKVCGKRGTLENNNKTGIKQNWQIVESEKHEKPGSWETPEVE